ncbi:MAG: Clp protease ClpP [Desulfobulbus sp.]|nr:Clp protease ClpP [Desulfobulbus sp.]
MRESYRPRIFARTPSTQPVAGRSWYRIEARAGADGAVESIEVLIYDEISIWGITAAQFINDFKAIDDGKSPVTLAINSPGGDIFDGFALNGWAQRLGDRLTARIDGLAASAASVIAVGASRVVIGQSAMMMIHNPWTFAYGEADDLRKTADMMDKARDSIIAAYQRKATAIDAAELVVMLDEETWLSADEAVALGLADAIAETAANIRACRGATGLLARFKHPPKALLDAAEETGDETEPPAEEHDPPPENDLPPAEDPAQIAARAARAAARIAQACLKAGVPELSEVLIMNTNLTDDAAVTAETGRVQAVRDLCATARLPELATDYIKSGLSAEAVRARLFDKLIVNAGREIDNKEPVVTGNPKTKASNPNHTEIYAARKGKKGA